MADNLARKPIEGKGSGNTEPQSARARANQAWGMQPIHPPSPISSANNTVSRPHLRALEGGSEGNGSPSGDLHAVKNSIKDSIGSPKNPDKITPDQLNKAESNQNNFKYSDDDEDANGLQRLGHFFWGSKTRRRSTISGGIIAVFTGGGIFGLSIISGPLEFVHLAQNLSNAHFSQQENAGDSRLGREIRYLRSGSSADTRDLGETRLGYLSHKYFNNIKARFAENGITLNSDTTGIGFSGVTIDPEKNDTFKNMSDDQLKEAGFTKDIGKDGKPTGTWSSRANDGFFGSRATLHTVLDSLNDSKVSTLVRMRVLGKWGLVSWSPLNFIDRSVLKTTTAINDYLKDKWNERISNGANVSMSTITGTDKDGNAIGPDGQPILKDGKPFKPTADQIASSNSATAKAVDDLKSGSLSDLVTKLRGGTLGEVADTAKSLLGPPSAALTLVCSMKQLDDNFKDIRYVTVILPLIRLGMNALSIGSEIMSGSHNVSMTELGYLAQNFIEVKNGRVASSWDQASNARNMMGETGGIDIMRESGEAGMITHSHIPSLSWTQNTATSAGCSIPGQVVTGALSLAITIFSGGTDEAGSVGADAAASAAMSQIISDMVSGFVKGAVTGIAINAAIGVISNILAGPGIVANHGILYGGQVDYGATMGANSSSIATGGAPLTQGEQTVLNDQVKQQDQQQFASQSFASRIFNPLSADSLVSRSIINNMSPSFSQNSLNIASSILHIGSSILSLPRLLFEKASASSAPPAYQYPFPVYGFSDSDLNSSVVSDPYANATYVADHILTGQTQSEKDLSSKYISTALQCFAVNIIQTPDPDGSNTPQWNVIPVNQTQPVGNQSQGFDPYDSSSYPQDCNSPSGLDPTNWLRLRMFILDTSTMEGYACADFNDATACSNDGWDQNATSTAYLDSIRKTEGSGDSSTSSTISNISSVLKAIF